MLSWQFSTALLLLAACATAVPTNSTNPTAESTEPSTSLECGPIAGQVLQGCRTCPATCSNPGLICTLQCVPGCGCPSGQLIDEKNLQCVKPEECPDPCDSVTCPVGTVCDFDEVNGEAFCLPSCKVDNGGCKDNEICELVTVNCIRAPCPSPLVRCAEKEPDSCALLPEAGPCKASLQRYFYNASSKQCEGFVYGGCSGNKNNFRTLESCEKKCSECPPTCTTDFCKGNLNAKCSIPDNNTTKKTLNCFGGCDETICSACYFSTEILPLPFLDKGCPNVCESDFSGETHSAACLRKWGKCVRRANLDAYGKPSHDSRTAENFKCWRPSCELIQIG